MVEKDLPASTRDRCHMTDSNDPKLSIRRRCELLGISRSSYYHERAGDSPPENLALNASDRRAASALPTLWSASDDQVAAVARASGQRETASAGVGGANAS